MNSPLPHISDEWWWAIIAYHVGALIFIIFWRKMPHFMARFLGNLYVKTMGLFAIGAIIYVIFWYPANGNEKSQIVFFVLLYLMIVGGWIGKIVFPKKSELN